MTLAGRNIFFRIAIIFCAVSTLMVLAASFFALPAYKNLEENTRRPADFLQAFAGRFLEANYFAVHASIVMAVLFSLAGIFLIFYFFEQTMVPEILYIAIFILSFSFEVIRLFLPLCMVYDIPSFYLLITLRILLFARYFGIFSLFTAGICATGLEVQMTRNLILIISIATLAITFGVPIDIQSWDTSLNIKFGFKSLFRMTEIIVYLITVISFFVAVNVRGSKEYVYIGNGLILTLAGRYLFLYFDNLAGIIPGILMLSFGTWFVCSKLHKIYLWM